MTPTPRLGLALGGGGSRAFVHLGVLSRLDEAGIRPACISGSSMGAVLGALYAMDPSGDAAINRILDSFRKSSHFGGLIRQDKGDGLHRRPGRLGSLARKLATASVAGVISFRKGLRRFHPVNAAIDDFFGKDNVSFDQLKIPFAANALNLTTGRCEDHHSGLLAPALKAGVAIGLVFAPFPWNDYQYADAAPVCPVPVSLCRTLGADRVLAVDICAPLETPLECLSGFDVVRRIMSVQSETLNQVEIDRADHLLKLDVSDVFWGDFSRIDELFERGRRAAESILPELTDLPRTAPLSSGSQVSA